jgi:hypothetical protein
MRLKNKVSIITGAAQGIGLAGVQGLCVPREKTLDEQIIFQQPTSASPAQFAQRACINR